MGCCASCVKAHDEKIRKRPPVIPFDQGNDRFTSNQLNVSSLHSNQKHLVQQFGKKNDINDFNLSSSDDSLDSKHQIPSHLLQHCDAIDFNYFPEPSKDAHKLVVASSTICNIHIPIWDDVNDQMIVHNFWVNKGLAKQVISFCQCELLRRLDDYKEHLAGLLSVKQQLSSIEQFIHDVRQNPQMAYNRSQYESSKLKHKELRELLAEKKRLLANTKVADLYCSISIPLPFDSHKFVDPDGVLEMTSRHASKLMGWMRPDEILRLKHTLTSTSLPSPTLQVDNKGKELTPVAVLGEMQALRIRQGGVGDCSFLSAIAVLAELDRRSQGMVLSSILYPKLPLQDANPPSNTPLQFETEKNSNSYLFPSPSNVSVAPVQHQILSRHTNSRLRPVWNSNGMHAVKLFINGDFRRVVVDDLFPIKSQNRMIQAHSSHAEEFWASLIEKAYLKVTGGSYALSGSNPAVDLFRLTGWVPETLSLKVSGDPLMDAATAFKSLLENKKLKTRLRFPDAANGEEVHGQTNGLSGHTVRKSESVSPTALSSEFLASWEPSWQSILSTFKSNSKGVCCLGTSDIDDAAPSGRDFLEGVSLRSGVVARHAYSILRAEEIWLEDWDDDENNELAIDLKNWEEGKKANGAAQMLEQLANDQDRQKGRNDVSPQRDTTLLDAFKNVMSQLTPIVDSNASPFSPPFQGCQRKKFKRRLLLVRNPWAVVRPKLRFCPEDTRRWTREACEQLAYNPIEHQKNPDDGAGWILFEDVLRWFSHLYLCWQPSVFPVHKIAHFLYVRPAVICPLPSLESTVKLAVFNDEPTSASNIPQFRLKIRPPPHCSAFSSQNWTDSQRFVWIQLSRHTDGDRVRDSSLYTCIGVTRGSARIFDADRVTWQTVYSNSECALLKVDLFNPSPQANDTENANKIINAECVPSVGLMRPTPEETAVVDENGDIQLVISLMQFATPSRRAFTLRVFAHVPITDFCELPPAVPLGWHTSVQDGSWTRATAGGSTNDHMSYFKNPTFRLSIPVPSPECGDTGHRDVLLMMERHIPSEEEDDRNCTLEEIRAEEELDQRAAYLDYIRKAMDDRSRDAEKQRREQILNHGLELTDREAGRWTQLQSKWATEDKRRREAEEARQRRAQERRKKREREQTHASPRGQLSANIRLFPTSSVTARALGKAHFSSGVYKNLSTYLSVSRLPPGEYSVVVSCFRPGDMGNFRLACHSAPSSLVNLLIEATPPANVLYQSLVDHEASILSSLGNISTNADSSLKHYSTQFLEKAIQTSMLRLSSLHLPPSLAFRLGCLPLPSLAPQPTPWAVPSPLQSVSLPIDHFPSSSPFTLHVPIALRPVASPPPPSALLALRITFHIPRSLPPRPIPPPRAKIFGLSRKVFESGLASPYSPLDPAALLHDPLREHVLANLLMSLAQKSLFVMTASKLPSKMAAGRYTSVSPPSRPVSLPSPPVPSASRSQMSFDAFAPGGTSSSPRTFIPPPAQVNSRTTIHSLDVVHGAQHDSFSFPKSYATTASLCNKNSYTPQESVNLFIEDEGVCCDFDSEFNGNFRSKTGTRDVSASPPLSRLGIPGLHAQIEQVSSCHLPPPSDFSSASSSMRDDKIYNHISNQNGNRLPSRHITSLQPLASSDAFPAGEISHTASNGAHAAEFSTILQQTQHQVNANHVYSNAVNRQNITAILPKCDTSSNQPLRNTQNRFAPDNKLVSVYRTTNNNHNALNTSSRPMINLEMPQQHQISSANLQPFSPSPPTSNVSPTLFTPVLFPVNLTTTESISPPTLDLHAASPEFSQSPIVRTNSKQTIPYVLDDSPLANFSSPKISSPLPISRNHASDTHAVRNAASIIGPMPLPNMNHPLTLIADDSLAPTPVATENLHLSRLESKDRTWRRDIVNISHSFPRHPSLPSVDDKNDRNMSLKENSPLYLEGFSPKITCGTPCVSPPSTKNPQLTLSVVEPETVGKYLSDFAQSDLDGLSLGSSSSQPPSRSGLLLWEADRIVTFTSILLPLNRGPVALQISFDQPKVETSATMVAYNSFLEIVKEMKVDVEIIYDSGVLKKPEILESLLI